MLSYGIPVLKAHSDRTAVPLRQTCASALRNLRDPTTSVALQHHAAYPLRRHHPAAKTTINATLLRSPITRPVCKREPRHLDKIPRIATD